MSFPELVDMSVKTNHMSFKVGLIASEIAKLSMCLQVDC